MRTWQGILGSSEWTIVCECYSLARDVFKYFSALTPQLLCIFLFFAGRAADGLFVTIFYKLGFYAVCWNSCDGVKCVTALCCAKRYDGQESF